MNIRPEVPSAPAPHGDRASGRAKPDPWRALGSAGNKLDERSLSRLKWRCRRGLLENDLFIERFFRVYEETITVGMATGLEALMGLADNDLLDLLLARKEPQVVSEDIDTHEVREVLALLRRRPPLTANA
jgi:antitoxin CptB